eukprot:5686697-Pleurochrysis_carterae.AAC.1
MLLVTWSAEWSGFCAHALCDVGSGRLTPRAGISGAAGVVREVGRAVGSLGANCLAVAGRVIGLGAGSGCWLLCGESAVGGTAVRAGAVP